MKKSVITLLALVASVAGIATVSGSINAANATSTPSLTCSAVLRKHPDGGQANWANDTFWRTTTFYKKTATTWTVKIADKGFFWTQPGRTSIGNKHVVIVNQVTGTFTGGASYTTTSTKTPACLGLKDYPEGYVYRDGPTTGDWPNHYFDGPTVKATKSVYTAWGWTYTTTYKVGTKTKTCETMTDKSGATPNDETITGDVTGKICK